MSTADWLVILGLVITVGASVPTLLTRLEARMKEYVREVYAQKADLARVEEKLAALDRDVSEVKENTRRILDVLTSKGPK